MQIIDSEEDSPVVGKGVGNRRSGIERIRIAIMKLVLKWLQGFIRCAIPENPGNRITTLKHVLR